MGRIIAFFLRSDKLFVFFVTFLTLSDRETSSPEIHDSPHLRRA